MVNNQNSTDNFNENNDASLLDWGWHGRIMNYFLLGGSLLTIIVLFFIVHTESGRTLASNPILREFILNTFPNAQLWVYSTLKFKQEIVLIYFYYVLLLLWAGGIVIYLFVLNWRRMVGVQKGYFAKLQSEKNLCTIKTLFKIILSFLLSIGLIVVLGFFIFDPSLTPMAYEDYRHTSGKGLNQYETWNTYIGLAAMFIAKVHLTFALILMFPHIAISILMCFKKNTFHTPN